MTPEKLFQANDALEKLLESLTADNGIRQDVANLKHSNDILKTQDIKSAIELKKADNRLMNVGIVGRVKAGKSSLLNALFFNGDNILPSAATPMTAALTTLTYGDSFKATVDFYNEADRANIAKKHAEYEQLLKDNINKHIKSYEEKNGTEPNTDQCERIRRVAKREIKNPTLSAAHDQYERMKKTGLFGSLKENQEISAANMQQLAALLLDYVGVDGQHMPFTKSVNISLPLDSLKDIRVIDTPGFNDPVTSREARTVELLRECDVIFVVSSASQFLSAEDFDMLSRITAKEGIQEIYVIASQIDNSFHASEKRATPAETLEVLTEKLASRIQSDIGEFKQNHPELGTTFDSLIHHGQSKLLYSSGMAYSIANKLANKQALDDGEITPWENLKHSFPNHFSDHDIQSSIHSLNSIANISNINATLIDVRSQKDAIMQKNIESFIAAKANDLRSYRDALLALADQQIKKLKETDRAEYEQKIKHHNSLALTIRSEMNDCYDGLVTNIKLKIDKEMIDIIDERYREVQKFYENNTEIETKTVRRQKSGALNWFARKVWGGGYESVTTQQTAIHTNHCLNALKEFIDDIERVLRKNSATMKSDFNERVRKDIMSTYRKTIGDDDLIDESIAHTAIEYTRNLFVMPEFSGAPEIPDNLKGRGKLAGSSADEFLEDLDDFTRLLHRSFKSEVTRYIRRVDAQLNNSSNQGGQFGDRFAKSFAEASEAFQDALNSINSTTHRLENFKKSLNSLELA